MASCLKRIEGTLPARAAARNYGGRMGGNVRHRRNLAIASQTSSPGLAPTTKPATRCCRIHTIWPAKGAAGAQGGAMGDTVRRAARRRRAFGVSAALGVAALVMFAAVEVWRSVEPLSDPLDLQINPKVR